MYHSRRRWRVKKWLGVGPPFFLVCLLLMMESAAVLVVPLLLFLVLFLGRLAVYAGRHLEASDGILTEAGWLARQMGVHPTYNTARKVQLFQARYVRNAALRGS